MTALTRHSPPFRADVVGSYLRPDYLHEARKRFAEGEIDASALKAVEDRAIADLVAKQKAAGLEVITDGEFRRSWWHLDFMWGLQGVDKAQLDHGYRFADMETRPETARLTGKLGGTGHPFLAHFQFLHSFADPSVLPRLTIPAPAQFFKELHRPENLAATQAIYPTRETLVEDIARAYQVFIDELYALGCRSLQFDDCTWGMMVDARYTNAGVAAANSDQSCCAQHGQATVISASIDDLARELLEINNLSLAKAPADMTITTHVCRGNYRSTWAAQGGYDPIAPYLFAKENVAAYYLEFDTDRSGDFSPLIQVSEGKMVVLGLVSSKTGELEKRESIIARIKEAARYLPLDRLCLSTQCGFASTEEGNVLTEEQQWAKIALIREIADEIWS